MPSIKKVFSILLVAILLSQQLPWFQTTAKATDSVPTGLRATPDDGQVYLSWNANTEGDLSSYKIYKNGGYLATVAAPATTYAATGLTNGTSYSFSISSVDAGSSESVKSSPINATPVLGGINYDGTKNAGSPNAVSFNGTVYAAFYENNASNRYQIRVRKWNGSAWVSADNNASLNYNTSNMGYDPYLVVYNNELYAAWNEGLAKTPVRVKKWNGSAWVSADGGATINYDATKDSGSVTAQVYNNELYIFWSEEAATGKYQMRTKKWNGTAWISADGGTGLNYDSSNDSALPKTIVFNNELYAAWSEGPSAGTKAARVKKWNGTAWVSADNNIGVNIDAAKNGYGSKFGIYNNELYVFWHEDNGAGKFQLRAKKWDGSAWVSADGGAGLNANAANTAAYASPIVFNNEFYALWHEDNGAGKFQIQIKKWNGTSWASANNGNSLNYNAAASGYFANPIASNNLMYAIYEENIGSNDRIRVKKWNGVAWVNGELPVPPSNPKNLSAATGNGQIALNWTANGETNLAGYKIYKNGVYLASVAAPAANYTATGLTNGTNYNFWVAAYDTEGNESAQSQTASAFALSDDANLSAVSLSNGTLSPAFSPATTSYSATVANGVASITVTAIANDASAAIKINGVSIASGAASAPIPLAIGNNTINVATTAQNGTTIKTYAIGVTRTPNTVPPAVPSGLNAVPGSGQTALSWSANSELDLAGYKIYKNGAYLATIGSPATSHTAAGLPDGADYTFSVSAYNTSGYESAQSPAANVFALGQLGIKAPSVSANFSNAAISPAATSLNAALGALTVSDATGTGNGWRVSLSASQFTEAGGAGHKLPQNSLTVAAPIAVAPCSGTQSPSPSVAISAPTAIDGGSAMMLLSAASGEGKGAYTVSFPANALTLSVNPSNARVDLLAYPSSPTIYQSMLTWSIISGP